MDRSLIIFQGISVKVLNTSMSEDAEEPSGQSNLSNPDFTLRWSSSRPVYKLLISLPYEALKDPAVSLKDLLSS